MSRRARAVPEPAKGRTMAVDELEQRAVMAWNALGRDRADFAQVDTLQREKARSVFRLRGAGPGGAAVIAKRCRHREALRERTIYADILPFLPVPSIRLHAFAAERESNHAWLFMEDAVGEPYDPKREDHRVLAGHGLGLIHTAAAALTPPSSVRDRGPASFRQDLQGACDALDRARSNPALTGDDVAVLRDMISRCRILASHWGELESVCRRLPQTLVHGDFKEDHIRIRSGGLVLFDWHEGGWGAPVLDAAKFVGYSVDPDITAYAAIVKDRWPAIDLTGIRRMGFIGEACRCVASIRWEAEKLRYEWVEGPMATLRVYSGWLDDVVRAEPWLEQATAGPEARLPETRPWF